MTFNLFSIVLDRITQGIVIGYWGVGTDFVLCGSLLYLSRTRYENCTEWTVDFCYISFIIYQIKSFIGLLRGGKD